MGNAITDSDGLFERLGGVVVVAKHFDLPVSTIGSWKSRRKIPSEHWMGIVEFARSLAAFEITYELLARLHAGAGRLVVSENAEAKIS